MTSYTAAFQAQKPTHPEPAPDRASSLDEVNQRLRANDPTYSLPTAIADVICLLNGIDPTTPNPDPIELGYIALTITHHPACEVDLISSDTLTIPDSDAPIPTSHKPQYKLIGGKA